MSYNEQVDHRQLIIRCCFPGGKYMCTPHPSQPKHTQQLQPQNQKKCKYTVCPSSTFLLEPAISHSAQTRAQRYMFSISTNLKHYYMTCGSIKTELRNGSWHSDLDL